MMFDAPKLIERLQSELSMTESRAMDGVSEYARFLLLKWKADVPERLSPSGEIDRIWHVHLLDNKDYRYMTKWLNAPMDHDPLGAKDGFDAYQKRYQATLEAYKRMFGDFLNAAFWPDVATSDNISSDLLLPNKVPASSSSEPIPPPVQVEQKKPNTRKRRKETSDGMEIIVVKLTGHKISVFCDAEDTIATLKQKICERAGHPRDEQRLIFNGKQLEDQRTLADYFIESGSVIHMVLRLRGC